MKLATQKFLFTVKLKSDTLLFVLESNGETSPIVKHL